MILGKAYKRIITLTFTVILWIALGDKVGSTVWALSLPIRTPCSSKSAQSTTPSCVIKEKVTFPNGSIIAGVGVPNGGSPLHTDTLVMTPQGNMLGTMSLSISISNGTEIRVSPNLKYFAIVTFSGFDKDQLKGSFVDATDIYIFSTVNNTEEKITNFATKMQETLTNQRASNLRWSSDSTQLAFTFQEDEYRTIYGVKVDGTDLRPLIRTEGEKTLIEWLEDNRLIYVESTFEGDTLYSINPDGTNQKVLLTPDIMSNITVQTISPDGNFVIYSKTDSGASSIYLINLETMEEQKLAQTISWDEGRGGETKLNARFSNTAKYITFQQYIDVLQIRTWTVGLDGTPAKVLANNQSFAWSPDDDWITYFSDTSLNLKSLDGRSQGSIWTLPPDRIGLFVIWLPVEIEVTPIACEVTAIQTSNLRSGPGTNFARQGSLSANQTRNADGRAVDKEGMTWFRLGSGVWIRADLVTTTGECVSLPMIES